MSRVMTASKLIEAVRQRAMIPTDTAVYSDVAILNIINEEMDAGLLSTLLVLSEEHLVNYEDIQFVAGKTRYPIPYRAVGNKLRDVSFIDSDGGVHELSRITLDQLSDYKSGSLFSGRTVFYIENNYVVLVDSNSGYSDTIRMHFYLRPNVIVLEKYVAAISAINTTTGVVSLSNFPTTFTGLTSIDFVADRSPNKIYKYDIVPVSIDSVNKKMTFNLADLPEELMVSDYICLREQSPVPNIPTELHPLLTQRASVHIMEALGDTEALGNSKAKLDQMEKSVNNLIDNRVEGAPQKVTPRHSTLNQTGGSSRNRSRR